MRNLKIAKEILAQFWSTFVAIGVTVGMGQQVYADEYSNYSNYGDSYYSSSYSSTTPVDTSLSLLLPNTVSVNDPRVTAWRDAASEVGLKLSFLTENQFLDLGDKALKLNGIVIPDQVYTVMSDVVVNAVKNFVSKGGQLMLVYDAGSLYEINGVPFYPVPKSRFSDMVGVDYVLYSKLLSQTIGFGPVNATESMLWELQVPPGKSMPFPAINNQWSQFLISNEWNPGGLAYLDQNETGVFYGYKTEHSSVEDGSESFYSSNDSTLPVTVNPSNDIHGVTSYVYGFLKYPTFVTEGVYAGKAIMSSPDFGLVAGITPYGNGKVLFVNLPLSYLKGQTDGMLMHGFLRYFGVNMLALPRLGNQPSGRGGLVLNWHVDSAEALTPMMQLGYMGVWNNGPFSIHITAGPDTISPGDGLGLDVPNNSTTQSWIKYFVSKGHNVASHGGWIHDYYGYNANEFNQSQYEPYLVMNKQAIEKISGRRITEYSPPLGNNPKWAVSWLEKNGVSAYYFAGHTGMGITRTYREGVLMNPNIWAVPVSPLGVYATFEEFYDYGVSESEVERWLNAMVDYNVFNESSRMIYFHPPGAMLYPALVKNLMSRTKAYADKNLFKWYTMTDLAKFMNRRDNVTWSVGKDSYGYHVFSLKQSDGLSEQNLVLRKTKYGTPSIIQGDAVVLDRGNEWIVVVRSGSSASIKSKLKN